MVGSISDMTAAAVVVSAVDNASTSYKKNIDTDVSMNNSNSTAMVANHQPEDADRVAAMPRADRDADDKQNRDDDKEQALDSLNEQFVSEMTKELNELMSKLNCDLEFQYHKEVNIMSVKMVDKNTKEVIKEYPPEDMVEGMIKAQEWLGAFLDKKV